METTIYLAILYKAGFAPLGKNSVHAGAEGDKSNRA